MQWTCADPSEQDIEISWDSKNIPPAPLSNGALPNDKHRVMSDNVD